MKKYLVVLVLVLAFLALAAPTPALAKALKVSARVAQISDGQIVFTAKPSKRSSVNVTVYQNGQKIRTIRALRTGKTTYKAAWTPDNLGTTAEPVVYTYKVAAAARSRKASTRGRVVVNPDPPVVVNPNPPVVNPDPPVVVNPNPPVVNPNPPVASARWVGFFQQGTPVSMTPLNNLEATTGVKSGVVHWYISDSNSFPTAQVQRVADHGSIPMITLEFWSTQNGGVATIANGSKDAYLNAFADAAKAYGGEIWIRPLHEMNGNWYPWCGTTNGNTPAQVVAAWRHIHDVFEARGATNVKLVWCVNNDSVPNTTANSADKYFPGEAYIDSMAIDGYNWGVSDPSWSTWRSFSSMIGSSYTKVTALSGKPLMIAEIGCPEEGGSKSAWIADMFAQIKTKYTRIQGVCWFNVDSRQTLNADWRVDSSASSAASFKAAAVGF